MTSLQAEYSPTIIFRMEEVHKWQNIMSKCSYSKLTSITKNKTILYKYDW